MTYWGMKIPLINTLIIWLITSMMSVGVFYEMTEFSELGDTFIDGCLQNIPHRVAIEFCKRGWIQRNSIVVKRKNPNPQVVRVI